VKIGSGKTKKVNGVDLSSSCFAFVGDIENTATWKVAVYFPGNAEKSKASILDAFGKFESMTHTWIPSESVQRVFDTIRGAALANGIFVERQAFEQQILQAPAPITTPKPEAPSVQKLRERNRISKEAEAFADRKADELLAMMGLE
jgi:hypothetical protein